MRYDRQGDQHYDVTSAFIKSIRGSDADAALHYLARMIEAGEDPRFIARRLVILASEDIGLADPTALTTAVAAAQAVQLIGMPEGRLNLAQATIALAVAPKSNAVITAIEAASADVAAGWSARFRRTCATPTTRVRRRSATARPTPTRHDAPYGVAEQQYAPDELLDVEYYRPTSHGAEAAVKERWERIRRIVRGTIGSIDMGWPFWAVVCLLVAMTALVVTLGVLFAGERRRGRAERAALLAEQQQLSARVEELSRAATAQRQLADEHADWVITRLGETEDDACRRAPGVRPARAVRRVR